MKLEITDGTTSVSNEATSFTQGIITESTIAPAESSYLTGDVTLNIYCYDGASTGVATYRLGTPITIFGVLEEEPKSKTLTSSQKSSGFKTFYDADNAYTLDDNTMAYVVISAASGKITLKRIEAVPQSTPVILHTTNVAAEPTTSAYYEMTLTKSDAIEYSDVANILEVTKGGEDFSGQNNIYHLGYTAANGVGFYLWHPTSAKAGEAYLPIYNASEAKFSFAFEDEDPTGVSITNAENVVIGDGPVYNLGGQAIDLNGNGIKIVNGKKFANQ